MCSYLFWVFLRVYSDLVVQVPRVFGPDLADNLGKGTHKEIHLVVFNLYVPFKAI